MITNVHTHTPSGVCGTTYFNSWCLAYCTSANIAHTNIINMPKNMLASEIVRLNFVFATLNYIKSEEKWLFVLKFVRWTINVATTYSNSTFLLKFRYLFSEADLVERAVQCQFKIESKNRYKRFKILIYGLNVPTIQCVFRVYSECKKVICPYLNFLLPHCISGSETFCH